MFPTTLLTSPGQGSSRRGHHSSSFLTALRSPSQRSNGVSSLPHINHRGSSRRHPRPDPAASSDIHPRLSLQLPSPDLTAPAPAPKGPKPRRMRTVSREDELVVRGANPRTGVVSPWVLSSISSGSEQRDYVGGAKADNIEDDAARREWIRTQRVRSGSDAPGSWRQGRNGWIFVHEGAPAPPTGGSGTTTGRRESSNRVVSGGQEEKRAREMKELERLARVRLHCARLRAASSASSAASQAVEAGSIDGDAEPRAEPPPSPYRIRRRPVSSGQHSRPREDSDSTVLIHRHDQTDGALTSGSELHREIDERDRYRVQIVTPHHSRRPSPDFRRPGHQGPGAEVHGEDCFLDVRPTARVARHQQTATTRDMRAPTRMHHSATFPRHLYQHGLALHPAGLPPRYRRPSALLPLHLQELGPTPRALHRTAGNVPRSDQQHPAHRRGGSDPNPAPGHRPAAHHYPEAAARRPTKAPASAAPTTTITTTTTTTSPTRPAPPCPRTDAAPHSPHPAIQHGNPPIDAPRSRRPATPRRSACTRVPQAHQPPPEPLAPTSALPDAPQTAPPSLQSVRYAPSPSPTRRPTPRQASLDPMLLQCPPDAPPAAHAATHAMRGHRAASGGLAPTVTRHLRGETYDGWVTTYLSPDAADASGAVAPRAPRAAPSYFVYEPAAAGAAGSGAGRARSCRGANIARRRGDGRAGSDDGARGAGAAAGEASDGTLVEGADGRIYRAEEPRQGTVGGDERAVRVQRSDSLARCVSEIRALVGGFVRARPSRSSSSARSIPAAVAKRLLYMLHHVLVTFAPGSRSLRTLTAPAGPGHAKADKEAYWAALWDVASAVGYLIVLVNLIVVLWRIVRMLAVLLGLVMAPARLMLVIWRSLIWS